ncbi:3-hydroxybutyryl-CoA dehydrogenase [Rhodococcus sp. RS1C4]|uniref:3-hydroxybutyryl-CoA dehydrogenase n=1 Tax=Nocardiaceae TaxID=85025 RepID=UPI0003810F96|nr:MULTISPECIES: 3-hydroxybutyryl-CoA dehydrogenase [Rhodococcus]OZC48321.1 3-hydroxybutyryl-CoA dehydrogenase [Rhodococcus sp. 06-621-2]OZC51778.1 3-hydroxybutyryl-CoA dehydrogenase [Rhodococcus sp. RS1C4]OZC86979.1 3-hydroxybutyryl-CoA dehydrogenase [Rhodococcus sp. 06-418-1B]OZD15324.1 3-hydroxybutyryl-CoA dehydrogenase [Rhodococcus sp. 06-156-4C]OZD19587.1 3-hydroxybutyryl-CoA dehydrogenase [Rhodococcus sp. 06-156-4a]
MPVERVGIVGAGQMGAGIAEVCARAHLDVLVYEHTRELTTAGRTRVLRSLDRGVSSGKITEREREQAACALRFTTDLDDFADRELVVEAVTEDEDIKSDIFARLDAVVTDPGAVLASNTSSIPIMKLGVATASPDRVVGLHFFNPVPVLPLVELVTTVKTSDAVAERAEKFAGDVLGKQVVRSADRSGFVVNALLIPYLLSAVRMVESGFASKEDIDKATVLGLAHPMGPLALADLIGLDTVKSIADSMYAEFGEPLFAAPPLLLRMVESGSTGKRTGAGFYRYENGRVVKEPS